MPRLAALVAAVLLAGCGAGGSAATSVRVVQEGGRALVVLSSHGGAVRYRVDGGPWTDYGTVTRPILDRTAASFRRWQHVGAGSFVRDRDGSVRTVGGLGMLWYPVEQFGDVVLRLQWKDVGGGSNSGVFVRFPDPRGQPQPEWAAIRTGNEVQLNDGDLDPQRTGSIYGFAPVTTSTPDPGRWNQLEVRITGGPSYRVVVLRDGRVVNTFVNRPGQRALRAGDPGTDRRQYATGYVGLQNHSDRDVVAFRDVTVTVPGPLVVVGVGRHTLEVRTGDRGPVRRVTFTVS